MLKIVITGPESSGKTTLARALAVHFEEPWVPEFARQYIDELQRSYRREDLLNIAKGQLAAEDEMAASASALLFCDTDLMTIKIWSEYQYGNCHPWIKKQIKNRRYHHYLLCKPDLPWVPDPQREHPHQRQELFGIYKKELTAEDKPFSVVEGHGDQRFDCALSIVQEVISSVP